jgi:hypothetical protein
MRSKPFIGDADILIAAIVKNNGGTLISNNIKHYQFVMGLNLTNWKSTGIATPRTIILYCDFVKCISGSTFKAFPIFE